MGGKSTSTSAPRLNQISVQTSTLGLPLSLGWGRGRMKCNLIWYNAFKATAHTTKQSAGGKGMGGASTNTTYTYTASVIMGICEGPIGGIRTAYKDTSVFSGAGALGKAGLSLANGGVDQPIWGYLTSYYPAEAVPYSGIAYVYAQDYALGDSATLANHSFEVDFAIQLGGGVCDADPKDIVIDFLQSSSHGVPGWAAGLLGDLSDWSAYCRANNLLLSPVLESQATASSILAEWTLATNSAAFWSEGVLKIKPYGDAAATGNGVTWAPNLTPQYDLTEDDFVAEDDDAPVVQTIKDQSDAYNIVQVEYLDRANAYNIAIATAQDLANIVEFGARKQDPTTIHSICDAAIAQKSVQLLLQRTLYVRETYNYRLPWNFVLLEPMDLVTLTTVTDELQLARVLVRIIAIDEDEDGLLAFTCEGVDVGTASAALYNSHSSDGYAPNTDIEPGAVSAPVLFVPPVDLTGFDPEVWIAAASTSTTWGGAEVWISADGTNYTRAGRIEGPARYGTLTATLPLHTDPDNANTLAVDLSTSLGALTGGSAADMNAGATLALVGNELVSYQNATLTGAYRYNLSPLRRGLHGTAPISHSVGQPFVRIDDAVFKLSYTDLNIGDTLYVKLASFNIYGRALQDLADVTAYTISLTEAVSRYTVATGAAEAASELAAGKSTIFYQDTPPTAAESSENDRWVNTAAGNLEYRRVPGNGRISFGGTVVTFPGYGAIVFAPWAPAPDQRIAQALTDAAGAQATADGKVATFNQEATPTAEGLGDLWYQPSTKSLKRWDGSSWVEVATVGATPAQIAQIAQALSDAANAQATADGKIDSFYQASPPGTFGEGDYWTDTDDGNKLYRASANSSAGGAWVLVRDTGIAQAIAAAAGAQGTADGKVTTFTGTSAPTATAVGDLWWNPTTGTFSRWNGTAWIATADQTVLNQQSIADVLPIEVAADYTGAIDSGTWPVLRRVTRLVGTTDVSPQTNYTVSASTGLTVSINNTAASSDRGVVSLTGMTVPVGTITVTTSYGGLTLAPAQIPVSRADGPPPSPGGGGSVTYPSSVSSYTTPGTSTSHVPITPVMSASIGTNGTATVTVPLKYFGATGATLAVKVQKSSSPTTGWTDASSEVIGSQTTTSSSDRQPGFVTLNVNLTGLPFGTYYFRLVGRSPTGINVGGISGTSSIIPT